MGNDLGLGVILHGVFAELCDDQAYLDRTPTDSGEGTLIDGTFDLNEVAKRFLQRLPARA